MIVIAGAVIFLISKKEKKYNGYNEELAATDEKHRKKLQRNQRKYQRKLKKNKKVLNLNAAGQNYCFCCVYLL